jgi:hypothetical protein
MFSRRDVPLDGSALLDDVIVSELAARRPAPITDPAVGLLAALVAAVDSRAIPDFRGAYDWVLDVEVAEPPLPPAGQVAVPTPLPAPQLAEPGPLPVGQLVIRRTWDGPRHRRNRPVRRRVTGSVAVASVLASTLGVSGVAAAVTGDPFRPFHSVVARVWHGVAGQPRTTDAREGSHLDAHARSATRVETKHVHVSAAPATHLRPVRPTGMSYSWTDVHGQSGTSIGPYMPGGVSFPNVPGLPVSPGGDGSVVGAPVNGPVGSPSGSQPGHPSGPVWLPSISFPAGGITSSEPPTTVQSPTP